MKTTATPAAPGAATLLATGCGTAIASVCAVGLHHIQDVLGGVWSVAAIAVAAVFCWVLARAFTRLSTVVPSGVGVLAFLSRAFGRGYGLALTAPYLLLTLALVGVEARIVGHLVSQLVPLPPLAGALGFVAVTWAVCQRGLRPGYRAQALATWALVALLGALSIAALISRGLDQTLAARVFPPAPSAAAFAVGVGNALFLFMGFELVTAQLHLGAARPALGRVLRGSVGVLALVYALAALGFSALDLPGPATVTAWMAPSLALAEGAAGRAGVAVVVLVALLASFTSFNGALLALSRLVAALASQGRLPRGLAKIDGTRLVPRRAVALLALLAMGATLALEGERAAIVVMAAAAAAASLVYAASLWARERPPFAEAARGRVHRGVALVLGVLLLGFGAGALAGAIAPPAAPGLAIHGER